MSGFLAKYNGCLGGLDAFQHYVGAVSAACIVSGVFFAVLQILPLVYVPRYVLCAIYPSDKDIAVDSGSGGRPPAVLALHRQLQTVTVGVAVACVIALIGLGVAASSGTSAAAWAQAAQDDGVIPQVCEPPARVKWWCVPRMCSGAGQTTLHASDAELGCLCAPSLVLSGVLCPV